MTESDRLNAVLQREAPAMARLLSPLGRRAAFPQGIPWQADQARHAEINATIGQLTDGRGNPMPPAELADGVNDLDPKLTWLYAPVEGPLSVRLSWLARQRRLAGAPAAQVSVPVASHGLTHSISLIASLFSSDDATLLVPSPAWENYELLFGLHASPTVNTWPFFAGKTLNVDGFAAALARIPGKAIVILNFPGNPSGYLPTSAEVDQLVAALCARTAPTLVVVDDAYQGWVYAEGRHPASVFWALAERADPERLAAIKVDGATKELLFFSSRVGFVTHTAHTADADEAMLSKLKFVIRGTVGCPSGPALALIQRALATGTLDDTFHARRAVLARRWRLLSEGLAEAGVDHFPFNSAFFALLPMPAGRSAEEVRLRLLHEHRVGAIAFPLENQLRLAYCSLHEDDVPELVRRVARVLA
jgi:aspartate/methionine/tyrosine aminotransferase